MVKGFLSSFYKAILGSLPEKVDTPSKEMFLEEESSSFNSSTDDDFEGDRETGIGQVTALDPDRGLGILNGSIRFDASLLPKLTVPLTKGIQVEYTATRGTKNVDLEVTHWKLIPTVSNIQSPIVDDSVDINDTNEEDSPPQLPMRNGNMRKVLASSSSKFQSASQASSKEGPSVTKSDESKTLKFKKLTLQVIKTGEIYFVVQQTSQSLPLKIDNSLFLESHLLFRGDWLDVTLEYEETNENSNILEVLEQDKPVSVRWTEVGKIIGKVTKVAAHYCVNEEIYCPEKSLTKGHLNLKLDDRCKVIYVLSDQIKESLTGETKTVHNFVKRSIYITAVTETDEKMNFEDRNILNQHEELEKLCKSKHNIIITPDHLNFGAKKVSTRLQSKFEIHNQGSKRVVLESVSLCSDQTVCEFSLHVKNGEGAAIQVIDPGSTISVTVKCTPKLLGRTREICVFNFGSFKIGRKISVWSMADEPEDFPLPSRPGTTGARKKKMKERSIEERDQLIKLLQDSKSSVRIKGPHFLRNSFFAAAHLPPYKIPFEITYIFVQQQLKHDGLRGDIDGGAELLHKKYPNVDWFKLEFDNYEERFHVAVHLEELQLNKLRKYLDLTAVKITIKKDSNLDSIAVIPFPEMFLTQEKCPLNVGDRLRCSYSQDEKVKTEEEKVKVVPSTEATTESSSNEEENPEKMREWYEGYIFEINSGVIHAKFGQEFIQKHDENSLMDVNFEQKRNTFRRMCHAICLGKEFLGKDWLFPTKGEVKEPRINFIEPESPLADSIHQVKDTMKAFKVGGVDSDNINLPLIRVEKFLNQQNKILAPSRVSSYLMEKTKIKMTTQSDTGITLRWFNQNLNPQQKDAVRRILRGQCRPLPHIIFGPPGTGKSVTVVEAIMQVNSLDPNSRILVTAPSNQAADLIAIRLANSNCFNPGDFVRLNGFMRNSYTIPQAISQYCVDGDKLNAIIKHKIIVCTISSAAQFFRLNLKPQHFSHVFIDEAGYSTEPETLIACVMSAVTDGQIVLAGDPCQLEPVLYHRSMVHSVLRQSLLERFINTPLYSAKPKEFPEDLFDPLYVTMLTTSYRLHPILGTLSSKKFYYDNLICSNVTDVELLNKLTHIIPNKTIPLMFHGVESHSKMDDVTKSWCNLDEARQCCDYVNQFKGLGVKSEDIGVISLYKKQVEVIKMRLKKTFNYKEKDMPTVSTIQGFQGGERKIIIVSTVISSIYHQTASDDPTARIKLKGFIYSSKMFNVIITRAKSLMIVLGDPNSLQYSPDWTNLMQLAIGLNVYIGCHLPPGIKIDSADNETAIVKTETENVNQETAKVSRDDDYYYEDDDDESQTFSPFDN